MEDKYVRTVTQLEKYACKWWPKEIRDYADQFSILQTLLDTQEKFISILKLANRENPKSIFQIMEAAKFSMKCFLKHLMILTDVGSEPLQRLNKDFIELFPNGDMTFLVNGKSLSYKFQALPSKGKLDNKKMRVDTIENLQNNKCDKALTSDLIMILMFGGSCVSAKARAVLFRCIISDYLGDNEKIDLHIRQNYIRVSRIIAGRTANDLGNSIQKYAANYIAGKLGTDYNVKLFGTIPGVSINDGNTEAKFDIVIDRISDESRFKPYIGVEVSFQETSNSTVERKGQDAAARFEAVIRKRSFVAYIIDGAGNFSRKAACEVMCCNSHCNVGCTPEEFDVLIDFIKEKLG
ncbi:MAG: hypothetical protein MJZ20_13920 [Bacteroidaceae bacterium]|nr:hypothetical protein [Bacteroidaceae bacterium]